MCTVTFINNNGQIHITSSRDEHRERPRAIWPFSISHNEKKLLFPKDPLGGGSWIVATDNSTVGVILNGAIQNHEKQPVYRKSRGVVLTELMKVKNGIDYFKENPLQDIEPFTIIYFDNVNLYKLQWDGENKSLLQLDLFQNYIWSSVTLYDPTVIKERELQFAEFLKAHPEPHASSIRQFHLKNSGDFENGFLIKRENGIQTQSLTQVCIHQKLIRMTYNDLQSDILQEEFIPVTSYYQLTVVGKN